MCMTHRLKVVVKCLNNCCYLYQKLNNLKLKLNIYDNIYIQKLNEDCIRMLEWNETTWFLE